MRVAIFVLALFVSSGAFAQSDTKLTVTREDLYNPNPITTAVLVCPDGSVLVSIEVDKEAGDINGHGIRRPTGYRATCRAVPSLQAGKRLLVRHDEIWNVQPSNTALLKCSGNGVLTGLEIDHVAVSNHRAASTHRATCFSGPFGEITDEIVFPESTMTNPRNTLKLSCLTGSAIASFEARYRAIENMRVGYHYAVTCRQIQ